MNRKKITVIIMAMFLFTVAGGFYKDGRSDIRISRESRTDFPRWSRTELSESREDEGVVASEEPNVDVIQNQTNEPGTMGETLDSEPCQRVYDSLDELEHDVI